MSSSESSSSLSPSPPQSPAPSFHSPPSLERLVTHFVAAKRSLNSTSHIYRANELVTSSRSLIEEIAILNAKNAYGGRGLDEQVDTLDAIRNAIVEDSSNISDDFQTTLADLDKAHNRLEKTLSSLSETHVAARFTAKEHAQAAGTASHSETSDSVEEENEKLQKTLYDFIDDTTHETLLQALRNLIDTYHSSRSDLDTDLHSFERLLTEIRDRLGGNVHSSLSGQPEKPTIYDEPPPTLAELFSTMESHATQMASLFGNLIDHHDKCVEALKHTEGGGEAARLAVQSEELTKHPPPGIEESLYGKTIPDPISEEERVEMLAIIEGDAPQVEDVVLEIKDYASELEDFYSQLTKDVQKARSRRRILREILIAIKSVRAAIPTHLDAAGRFREIWRDIHVEMQSKTKEVASLAVFYEQFLFGYGQLLREVERRKSSEAQMKRVADKARHELKNLCELDKAARDAFMEDVGEYLPSDLGAWHGLNDATPIWDVRIVDEGTAE